MRGPLAHRYVTHIVQQLLSWRRRQQPTPLCRTIKTIGVSSGCLARCLLVRLFAVTIGGHRMDKLSTADRGGALVEERPNEI